MEAKAYFVGINKFFGNVFAKAEPKPRPIAALVGQTGVGKTYLYNKLCNTSHSTDYNVNSITKEIRKNDVSHGDHPFEVLDTPGNNSKDQPILHALLIKEALT